MSSKEELVTIIKEWIENDEKVKEMQAIIKEYKNKKKNLTVTLLNIMKTNEIDCFDINSGKIVYCKSKTKVVQISLRILNNPSLKVWMLLLVKDH